jgi:hypothetical protein
MNGGPGKITMPDGTEIDVMFEPFEVKFLPFRTTHVKVQLDVEPVEED